MPLITVDDQGHTLCYEDTGALPNVSRLYTTLMIVHGTGFHAQIFRRLVPLAPQHQVRLVLINRRDYPGSSPYTEEELDNERVVSGEFARARAAEFARFIQTFIEKENIPKATSDWKQGGVVLVAWSSGNGYTLPLLAYVDSIPESTREFLESYLRSLVVFDAPSFILGVWQGPDVLKDTSLPEEERIRRFSKWVSSYYTHKSLTSRNVKDLQLLPVKGSMTRKSTIESMTPEEIQETTYSPAVTRSENTVRMCSPAIHAERIRRAAFDDELAKYWPRAGIDVVWCENSTWVVVDAMWQFQKAREKADEDGIKGRPLRIVMMPGANHFPHWDEPETTMKFLAEVINPPLTAARL